MHLKEIQKRVHELSRAKGWYDGAPLNVPEKLALIHSEISESLEDVRKPSAKLAELGYEGPKPCGFPSEISDALIRIADLCGAQALDLAGAVLLLLDLSAKLGIDVEEMVEIKHAYNKTRPYRHGGKTC